MNSSSAVTRPQISSFDVFAARPSAWLGLALSETARTKSRRPARMAGDCAPRAHAPAPTREDAGGLRPADALAPAEAHEIGAEPEKLGQVLARRQHRRRVD